MRIPKLTLVYDRQKRSGKNKTGTVEIRISQGKDRKYISTGVRLLPKEWSNGSVVGRRDWKELNGQLQLLLRRCSEIVTEMMEQGCLELGAIPRIVDESIVQQQTFLSYAEEKAERRKAGLREGTRKRYKVVFDFLKEWKGIVHFADVTEQNVLKMDECLKKRGLKECSRYSYHKVLKIFVVYAFADGLIPSNPYAKVKIKRGEEDGLQRCLTPQEFHRFERCKIEDSCLERVRDLFVFQTYTMMSYSDLELFKMEDCVKMDGKLVYRSKRIKTLQPFTVVLMRPALAILEKYGGKLPLISNVKYNLYLKAAVKYAKIDKAVTTHWARHTGATMMLNEGNMPMHIVQHILGHASIKETERTYAKVLDRTIVEQMTNYEKSV